MLRKSATNIIMSVNNRTIRIIGATIIFIIVVTFSIRTTSTFNSNNDDTPPSIENIETKRIEDATRLLQSIGALNICHPNLSHDNPTSTTSLLPPCNDITTTTHHRLLSEEPSPDEDEPSEIILNATLSLLCVTIAALAAGLTMGLLSLDPLLLLIKIRSTPPTAPDHRAALSLLPIVQQHHRLLVTLLLMNAIANEALPLFLDRIVPGYVAVIVSVTLVLVVGEIIPTAVFTGPDQMIIASRLSPVVKLCMVGLAPLAVPIAKVLDYLLGADEELNLYNRGELKALVRILYEERVASKTRRKEERRKSCIRAMSSCDMGGDGIFLSNREDESGRYASIHIDEVTMVQGALEMKTKVASDVATHLSRVYCLPYDTVLNEKTLVNIYSKGYSRIPVYERDVHDKHNTRRIRGVLMTRQLIVVNDHHKRIVSDMPLLQPVCVSPFMSLVELLNIFQRGSRANKGGHMAIVCTNPEIATRALAKLNAIPEQAGVIGIVTMEDVIEELLQEEIFDEYDSKERKLSESVIKKWKSFVVKKKKERESLMGDVDETEEEEEKDEEVLKKWKVLVRMKKDQSADETVENKEEERLLDSSNGDKRDYGS